MQDFPQPKKDLIILATLVSSTIIIVSFPSVQNDSTHSTSSLMVRHQVTTSLGHPTCANIQCKKKHTGQCNSLDSSSHNALTRLITDASDQAVGGILEQLQAGKLLPVSFFSKSLHKAETCYSAFDREILALYLAINHFHYFLDGHSFTAYTDQKP